MSHFSQLQLEYQGNTATLWLNRPERHNALNETLIAELSQAIQQLQTEDPVRVIILAGRGKSFSAGADLDWMQRAAAYSAAENLADAQCLAQMLKNLYRSRKPIIARIHGAALAGGTGLAAACDIVIATPKAQFGLTEVRLGLIPATIGPYVMQAIGARQARRYFLTAERIDAASALRLGLVHEVVEASLLDTRIAELAAELSLGGPQALGASKDLLCALQQSSPWEDALLDDTAQRIADIRSSSEAREGLAAFFEKRPARW